MKEQSSARAVDERFWLVLTIWAGLIALFFLFGDRVLRAVFGCTYMNSLVIWVGALAMLLLGGAVIAHVMTRQGRF